jgi:signal transducing adaptor molecule
LLQALKAIDPSKGERIDDSPEVEVSICLEDQENLLTLQGMYQASVELQGQINDLIKKYSDQKGELRG